MKNDAKARHRRDNINSTLFPLSFLLLFIFFTRFAWICGCNLFLHHFFHQSFSKFFFCCSCYLFCSCLSSALVPQFIWDTVQMSFWTVWRLSNQKKDTFLTLKPKSESRATSKVKKNGRMRAEKKRIQFKISDEYNSICSPEQNIQINSSFLKWQKNDGENERKKMRNLFKCCALTVFYSFHSLYSNHLLLIACGIPESTCPSRMILWKV